MTKVSFWKTTLSVTRDSATTLSANAIVLLVLTIGKDRHGNSTIMKAYTRVRTASHLTLVWSIEDSRIWLQVGAGRCRCVLWRSDTHNWMQTLGKSDISISCIVTFRSQRSLSQLGLFKSISDSSRATIAPSTSLQSDLDQDNYFIYMPKVLSRGSD